MDWVYDEVLPSIRKTGSYTAPGAQVQMNLSPKEKVAFMIRMAGSSGSLSLRTVKNW